MQKGRNKITSSLLRSLAVKGAPGINYAKLAVVFLIALSPFLSAMPVAADPAQPDSLSIPRIYAQRNLLENGDMGIFFEYNIVYAAPPADPASTTYFLQLMNGTAMLGWVAPVNYHTGGYGVGASSFYFPAATAPTWGATYTIRIIGNPTKFLSTVPSQSFAVPSSAYTTSTAQADNQQELYTHIITIAEDIKTAWESTYLITKAGTTGTILDQDGDNYFKAAMPGIAAMAPLLFAVQTGGSVDWTKEAWTITQATTYEERFNGTWIGQATKDFSGRFNMSSLNFNTFIVCLGILLLIGLSVYYDKNNSPTPGLMAGTCLETCGVLLGAFPMGVAAVITMFCVIFIGAVWWPG